MSPTDASAPQRKTVFVGAGVALVGGLVLGVVTVGSLLLMMWPIKSHSEGAVFSVVSVWFLVTYTAVALGAMAYVALARSDEGLRAALRWLDAGDVLSEEDRFVAQALGAFIFVASAISFVLAAALMAGITYTPSGPATIDGDASLKAVYVALDSVPLLKLPDTLGMSDPIGETAGTSVAFRASLIAVRVGVAVVVVALVGFLVRFGADVAIRTAPQADEDRALE